MPEITINTNGPIIIPVADVVLKAADGSEIPLPSGAAIALCRCGQSSSKPFCDGTHKPSGFKHDPTA